MNKNIRRLNVVAIVALVSLSGCASITGTTGQNVSVETRSVDGKALAGANCEMTNSKGKWFVTTPGSVGIRRSNDDLLVLCTKEGSDAGRASVVSDTKGSMFGNIIFGGGIGAIIDHNQGSAYEYPSLIQIIMGSSIKIETKPSEGEGGEKAATAAPATAKAETSPTARLVPETAAQPKAGEGNQSESYRKLKELDALRKDGVLTQQEFEAKKAEILKGI